MLWAINSIYYEEKIRGKRVNPKVQTVNEEIYRLLLEPEKSTDLNKLNYNIGGTVRSMIVDKLNTCNSLGTQRNLSKTYSTSASL